MQRLRLRLLRLLSAHGAGLLLQSALPDQQERERSLDHQALWQDTNARTQLALCRQQTKDTTDTPHS
jgi:hypothetical protein